MERFRLGINYWPATSAMYLWRRFDAAEVAGDFARIRAAGFDSVRVFLLWEDFQPAPDQASDEALRKLVTVVDLAARNKLSLMPTLFTGHMSGVNWIPTWALEAAGETARFRVVSGGKVVRAKLKNWYSDPNVMQAQALLAREVAAALAGHPALWAYDLGNENSNCVTPPTRDAAVAWLETMTGAIRAVDSSRPITIGLHMEDLEEDRRLGPKEAARVCDFLCMHGYPVYADWARGETDEMLLPFLGLMTRWLGGKDVLFEEFGTPTRPRSGLQPTRAAALGRTPLLEEEEAAQYVRRALAELHRFGMTGAVLWCFGDYAEKLWSEPPLDEAAHERFFGLWRSDHSTKPALSAIKGMAGATVREWCDDFDWIDVTEAEFYLDPRGTLRRLYQEFLRKRCP
jgi:endo-1,4-beta-mannosidase